MSNSEKHTCPHHGRTLQPRRLDVDYKPSKHHPGFRFPLYALRCPDSDWKCRHRVVTPELDRRNHNIVGVFARHAANVRIPVTYSGGGDE